jgi:asparagine synthase (glutamine-hydrolysing)
VCGMIGTVSARSQPDSFPADRLNQALATLQHRGPDGQGQFRDEQVWLGHTRLSIIDLTNAGNQPMESDTGRFVITYNGEVYNYRELAAKYSLGPLRSSSDTEIVLRLFEKLGVASFRELNGIFAFCVYDRQVKKIWLVRDRLGVKPLYFRADSREITFASEVKAILALGAGRPMCDLAALHEWLYYGNPLGSKTLFLGIQQLLPAHYLELDLSSLSSKIAAYWSLGDQAHNNAGIKTGRGDAVSSVRRLLEQAVTRQLVSDVPIGVFLSGGVDSSAIAAFAARHYGGRLATYSVGFDFAVDGGELPRAARVAAKCGTEHNEIHISGEDTAGLVEKMVRHHDMPFADAANLPLYLMAERLRGRTKVVLQGDGGDELFGGYRRYATLKYYPILHPLAVAMARFPGIRTSSPLAFRAQRYIDAFAAADLPTTMALLLTPEDRNWNPEDVFAAALGGNVRVSDPFARYRELFPAFSRLDISNQMSLVDMSIVLPDTYLEKVDRSTMAAGLEVRVPFLDNDLVDYVVALSGGAKMPFGRKKWLLKAALRGIVPDEVLFAPKTGFNVPFAKWLQTSLKPLFFDNLAAFARARPDVLNVDHIKLLFSRTCEGRQNHSPLLWKVLNFLIWVNVTKVEFAGC